VIPAAVVAVDSSYAERTAFYDAVKRQDYAHAVQLGEAYAQTHPHDDAFALDLAYAEINAGRREQALALLQRLSTSKNATVASAASKQYAAMNGAAVANAPAPVPAPPVQYKPPPGYAYVYSQYESALADIFSGAFVRYDLLDPATGIRPFAALHLSYDTRSGVPGFGQVYNDNAAVFDAGLRDPTGAYGYLFIEGGYSAGLRGQKSFPEVRYGYNWSRDYGAFDGPNHALLDGSFATYSRYQGNTLGYLAPSYDVRLSGPLRALAGVTYSFDMRGIPGNDFVDVYAGPMARVSHAWQLRTVAVRRMYLTPSPANYTGLRVLFVYGSGVP
jgi:hypothetical protein